jgi:formylglycine-generating enzyme required for sulfatase activity
MNIDPSRVAALSPELKFLLEVSESLGPFDTSRIESEGDNFLGMKFVSIPRYESTKFCVWLFRVVDLSRMRLLFPVLGKDICAPDFPQDPQHPLMDVSWFDAIEICAALTLIDRELGHLSQHQVYRLPTDREWSAAVGLPHEIGETPFERSCNGYPGYPWGSQWPPPQGAGNYSPELGVDSYEHTSPVGVFTPNALGIYDLGGNVDEWCMSIYNSKKKDTRVTRGNNFIVGEQNYLRSSYRWHNGPSYRGSDHGDWTCQGFRVVLADLVARKAG